MRITILLFSLLLFSAAALGQKNPYVLLKRKKKLAMREMMKSMETKDIILFGEHHNNPISHWLQYTTDRRFTQVTQPH
ncbi:MAG: hypothetical protein R2769_05420 [Saprospiraceae bacterium]